MGASELAERKNPVSLPALERESNLREVPGLAQLARPSQGALEESVPQSLPSRLWLNGPPARLTLLSSWSSGDPQAVPSEAGRADQTAEQLYQLHHSAEEEAPGAGPHSKEVRTPPHPEGPSWPLSLGLGVGVSPGGVEGWC